MALVTFSNPEYRDKTVYAVAGSHTESLLKLARENKIPINYECEDGECGTCLVKVSSVDKKLERMCGPLTEKEKTVLRNVHEITCTSYSLSLRERVGVRGFKLLKLFRARC